MANLAPYLDLLNGLFIRYLLILGLGGLCIAIAAALILYRSIVGPVRELVHGSELIGSGNLDHRIDVESSDEFGHLAVAFNRMVANLQRSRAALHEAHDTLEKRVQDRTRTIEEFVVALELEVTKR